MTIKICIVGQEWHKEEFFPSIYLIRPHNGSVWCSMKSNKKASKLTIHEATRAFGIGEIKNKLFENVIYPQPTLTLLGKTERIIVKCEFYETTQHTYLFNALAKNLIINSLGSS